MYRPCDDSVGQDGLTAGFFNGLNLKQEMFSSRNFQPSDQFRHVSRLTGPNYETNDTKKRKIHNNFFLAIQDPLIPSAALHGSGTQQGIVCGLRR